MTTVEPDDESAIHPFSAYTDAEQARRLLQDSSAQLFGRRVTVTSCSVIDSLYKTYAKRSSWPRSTLHVCWLLGRYRRQHDPLRQGLSRRPQPRRVRRLGELPVAIHLPAHDMIVWRFPHDPSMPHLAEAVLPQAGGREAAQLGDRAGGPRSVTAVSPLARRAVYLRAIPVLSMQVSRCHQGTLA